MTQEPANAIDEKAIAFVTRLDQEPQNQSVQAQLDAWLQEDTRHEGAYLRAQAAFTQLDRLSVLPTRAPTKTALSRRKLLIAGAGTALAASAAGVALWLPSRNVIAT